MASDDFPTRTWMPFHPYTWEALTTAERAAILEVFIVRVDAAGDVEWVRRADREISDDEAAAANKALSRLETPALVQSRKRHGEPVPLPTSPESGALRTWHLMRKRPDHWSADALTGEGSPLYHYLAERRSTDDSRKQLVTDLVTQVDQFEHDAPRWWFDFCLSAALTDWPHR